MTIYLKILTVVSSVLLAYFFIAPAAVDPLAYHPPEAPAMQGVFAQNTHLREVRLLDTETGNGPEDLAIDHRGQVFAGLADGRIVRIVRNQPLDTIANTGGRPLGLDFDDKGNLIIADAYQGLLRLIFPNRIEVLARAAEGEPFGLTDDVDVAADGRIYFTDASMRWPLEKYQLDAMEARPYGRLLRYDPARRSVEVLLRDLYFPNGVAVSADGSFVLVNETWRYRTLRYWLTGARAGESEVFLENLPGFPDGVSSNGQGIFWIALVAPRSTALDRIHPYPWLKRLSSKLPPELQPQPEPYGLVLGVNADGKYLYNLQDPEGERIHGITSVEQSGQYLFLGTLEHPWAGQLHLANIPLIE